MNKKMRILTSQIVSKIIFLCLFCSVMNTANAVNITNLYRVHVVVEDRTSEARKLGIQQAFQQLMVKISGSQQALSNDKVISASARASRYMQGYSYRQISQQDPENSALTITQPLLEVWFSKPLIAKVLRQAQVPIWSNNRPLIQLWLYQGEQLIENNDEKQQAANAVWQSSYQRVFDDHGLPVLWPEAPAELESVANNSIPSAADAQQRVAQMLQQQAQRISLQDVRNSNISKLRLLNESLHVNASLMGQITSISQAGQTQWQLNAMLVEKDKMTAISLIDKNVPALLHKAAAQVAQYYSDQYAVVTSTDENGQTIYLENIESFAAYASSIQYLKKLAGVKRVDVLQVQDQKVTLGLILNSSWQQIFRVIKVDGKLIKSVSAPSEAGAQAATPLLEPSAQHSYLWRGES